MFVIGLTGGIASGKSTISSMLANLDATIIDADKVGHEAYQPHSLVWEEVVAAFGRDILKENEEIDRPKLGSVVFRDPAAMLKLNGIMHPRMLEMMRQRIDKLKQEGVQLVVIEAAILIEAKWTPLADEVWVVYIPEEVAIQRLISRNGFSPEQARDRVRSQMPIDEKAKLADVVVDNNRALSEVEIEVRAVLAGVKARSVLKDQGRLS
ncbi:MAG: dephospho-CoA kinase [Dehalococcoidia bacterium]|nr:dephospho-CoA kinase [Dehalococcoidia bacterium]